MMIDFKNIGLGVLNLIKSEFGIADPEVEQKSAEKLATCSDCPSRSNFPEPINKLAHCKECGCSLIIKSKSDSTCPLNRW